MERQRPVSIKDVARAAGVSTTTVSHALNGKGRLPEETRERVRIAARDLGYRPSAIARGLVSGRTGVLGLAATVPGMVQESFASIEYFSRVINGATAEATQQGYALVIVPATDVGDVWQRVAVDGAVVVDPIERDPNPDAIRAQSLALVTIGGEDGAGGARGPATATWTVDNDIEAAVGSVLDHLTSAGAHRPALLSWRWPDAYTQNSVRAYEAWCLRRGLSPAVVLIAEPGRAPGPVRELLGRVERVGDGPGDEGIDAVFALYEPLGAMTLAAAAERGLAIPGDLLVAATADTGIGRSTMPTLTTLELHADRLGAEAIGLLIDRIEGRSVQPEGRLVDTSISVRASTTRS